MTPQIRSPSRLFRAAWVLPNDGTPPIADGAVAIDRDGRILAVGPARDFQPAIATTEDLGHAVLMPGLVNAHQHGRGVSQLLMGYPDLPLEPWIAGRRRHGPPDIYAVTRLAAEAMLANGVTATLHANYSYGSGDYEAEFRAQIEAYRDAGMRATLCLGVQDQGAVVYPDMPEAEATAAFPEAAQAALGAARPAWTADLDAAMALMEAMQRDHDSSTLIRMAWGPAGPQWVRDETWRRLASDAAERGVGIHFHLLESPAQAAAARRLYPEGTLARLRALGVFAARVSAAHAVHLSDDDRRIAAGEGLVAVLNPGSNMRLSNGLPPFAALRSAGITLAIGTDNCALADDEDLLAELRLASILGRDTGLDAPDAAEILSMATDAGARATFLEEGCGRLVPGAPADLCAYRLDRIAAGGQIPAARLTEWLLARGCGADCILTVVAGQVRFRATEDDRARLSRWRQAAVASVASRPELVSEAGIAALQAALAQHYAGRS